MFTGKVEKVVFKKEFDSKYMNKKLYVYIVTVDDYEYEYVTVTSPEDINTKVYSGANIAFETERSDNGIIKMKNISILQSPDKEQQQEKKQNYQENKENTQYSNRQNIPNNKDYQKDNYKQKLTVEVNSKSKSINKLVAIETAIETTNIDMEYSVKDCVANVIDIAEELYNFINEAKDQDEAIVRNACIRRAGQLLSKHYKNTASNITAAEIISVARQLIKYIYE